jgi:hypothetical protein
VLERIITDIFSTYEHRTERTNSTPPPPGTPLSFSLSDENDVKNSYLMSGFKDPAIERMIVAFDFDFHSPYAYTTFSNEQGGPVLQKMLAGQTNDNLFSLKQN